MKKTCLELTALLLSFLLMGCSHSNISSLQPIDKDQPYNKARDLANFEDYVQFLKAKALGKGVSIETLTQQQNINYIESAVRLDKKQAGNAARRKNLPPQPPNPHGITRYLNKHLTQAKVNKAVEYYWSVKAALNKVSKQYGVQPEFILALWGMESSFGRYQGKYDVLSVLATLAFDGRREKLFSQEFINAMQMLDQGYLNRSQMLGSWAGAMGQTQFMPTSYLNYAADGNEDKKKDIWTNQDDVFASIANYLAQVGWDSKLPWGIEVTLTQVVDLSLAGTEKSKARSWSDWQRLGVVVNNNIEQQKLTALSHTNLWLVLPDKQVGRAFLVSNNFRTLLDWNRSNYYAVSVGMFSDRISLSFTK